MPVDNETSCRDRARAIMRDLIPVQKAVVTDPAPHVSAICPRRAGKSYCAAAAALITGEAKPGSISLIISLNLKQLKRIYWAGGPSGLFTLNRKYGIGLEFNKTECRWEHQNGSIGYLLGAEDPDQREVIRGLEADIYVVDECKSFAPDALRELIDDIVDPSRATRQGRLILIGTPGNIPAGPFYEATCDAAVDEDQRPHRVAPGATDDWGRTADSDLLWSAHSWTLEDNTAAPHQWREAMRKKRAKKWADDDPTWRREYLGKWTNATDGTVFRYFQEKIAGQPGHVVWTPEVTDSNPTGLPATGAPWHLIGGLDMGFEAPTAFVVAGYSQTTGEVRHVWDHSESHMLVHDVADMINDAQRRFGKLEAIHADMGNLGKMIVQTLIDEHGFPMVRARKADKYDHIEMLNAAFHRGEVKIIEGTQLEHQLITVQWALGDQRFENLRRMGRLIEDVNVPNDSSDAMLYLYRGAMHRYGADRVSPEIQPGTTEWVKTWERDQLRRARIEVTAEMAEQSTALSRRRGKPWQHVPGFLRESMMNQRERQWIRTA